MYLRTSICVVVFVGVCRCARQPKAPLASIQSTNHRTGTHLTTFIQVSQSCNPADKQENSSLFVIAPAHYVNESINSFIYVAGMRLDRHALRADAADFSVISAGRLRAEREAGRQQKKKKKRKMC